MPLLDRGGPEGQAAGFGGAIEQLLVDLGDAFGRGIVAKADPGFFGIGK